MKKLLSILMLCTIYLTLTSESCDDNRPANTSAKDEQAHTENNQQLLNRIQPAPSVKWSLERDNLIKRFKLQNDRSVVFYMYIFNEGIQAPIGYYQVNKVSSVNSQLTNTMQLVEGHQYAQYAIPSPAEDGSYGTNGNAVFGFTPADDVYIETSMHYIASTIPLSFPTAPNRLAIVSAETSTQLKNMMNRINAQK